MKSKIVVKVLKNERKCGGCNWEDSVFYGFEGDKPADMVCATCFLEFLVNENAIVELNG